MKQDTGTAGADRVAEAVKKLGGDIVVNIQADNFGLRGAVVAGAVKKMLADPKMQFATLARTIKDDKQLFDPDVVKVITDAEGRALCRAEQLEPFDGKASQRVAALIAQAAFEIS